VTPRRQRPPDPVGATPLTDDDLEGLIPTDVATRGDLDRAELENIVEARTWAAGRTWKPDTVLDSHTLADLHRRMFRQVWRWAGKWRSRETSIGIAPERIQTELRMLVDDALAWTEFTTYPADEIAIRFHHRLVFIHPFPNGNGRHARLAADLLMRSLGQPVFTWSQRPGVLPDRKRYREALQAMDRDREDVARLLKFARG
jgi:Fic-DOC domain mobile mystery protein B